MTEDGLTPRRAARIAILMTGLLLQACAANQGPYGAGARVYAADVTGGAKACEVPKISPSDGQTIDATIKLGNDGGWCGLSLRQSDGKSYDAGLLSERPTHGNVVIHEVGDDTRIDYTPDRAFTGSDSFVVKLVPGSAVIRVSVSVVPASKA